MSMHGSSALTSATACSTRLLHHRGGGQGDLLGHAVGLGRGRVAADEREGGDETERDDEHQPDDQGHVWRLRGAGCPVPGAAESSRLMKFLPQGNSISGLGETSVQPLPPWPNDEMRWKHVSAAQVVVLAGPSGAGKSRLAERLGLPVLRLDDFYKDGDDPSLPRITVGANAGLVDWDDPASWHEQDALAALRELCTTGRCEVPVYEISRNGRGRLPAGRPRRAARCSSRRGSSRPRSWPRAATRACSRRRTASPSTPSSPSGAGSPATCASTASPRSCWSAAAWR